MGRLALAVFLIGAGAMAQSDGFVSLVPRQELSELWVVVNCPPEVWSLKDSVIAAAGKPMGYLRTKQKFKNYIFRAEWQFPTEGWKGAPEEWPNAGFFIHAGEEPGKTWPKSFIEVQGHYGEAGSMFGGRIKGSKRGPIVKDRVPFGEWDRYEVTSQDGAVKVVLNGVQVNEGWGADPAEGYICLQSEGWPVFYRKLEIKILS